MHCPFSSYFAGLTLALVHPHTFKLANNKRYSTSQAISGVTRALEDGQTFSNIFLNDGEESELGVDLHEYLAGIWEELVCEGNYKTSSNGQWYSIKYMSGLDEGFMVLSFYKQGAKWTHFLVVPTELFRLFGESCLYVNKIALIETFIRAFPSFKLWGEHPTPKSKQGFISVDGRERFLKSISFGNSTAK